MCGLCVRLVLHNNKPYSFPAIVSLPSKSVREQFRMFFDMLFSNCHFFERVFSSFFLMKTLLSVIIYQSFIN
jgi:hypothetical protein